MIIRIVMLGYAPLALYMIAGKFRLSKRMYSERILMVSCRTYVYFTIVLFIFKAKNNIIIIIEIYSKVRPILINHHINIPQILKGTSIKL